jgi:nitroimidazol reductase NimA-like FMN-containing flavoprotein (pyridoxamine 5'-phosphate oxidase superfamily)
MMDFGKFSMTDAELTAFLSEKPRFASLASLRKDGSPFVIPLGYLYEQPWMYFTFAPDRAVVKRLRRDPRVAITVYNEKFPVKFVLVTGNAEEVPDPDLALTRRKHHWMMSQVAGIDHAEFERNHLAVGRVVFRVRLGKNNVASMDNEKMQNLETEASVLPGERHKLGPVDQADAP